MLSFPTAVRLLEEFYPQDLEAKAAAAISRLGAEGEFQAEEMAKRREEAELAAEEDSEDALVRLGMGGG